MFMFINPIRDFTPQLMEIVFLLKIMIGGGLALIFIQFINLIVNISKRR